MEDDETPQWSLPENDPFFFDLTRQPDTPYQAYLNRLRQEDAYHSQPLDELDTYKGPWTNLWFLKDSRSGYHYPTVLLWRTEAEAHSHAERCLSEHRKEPKKPWTLLSKDSEPINFIAEEMSYHIQVPLNV